MLDPQLAGKVALITGANSRMGIGAAVAKAFAAQGSSVFVTYVRGTTQPIGDSEIPGEAMYHSLQHDTADWLVDEIRQHGGRAAAMEADLSDPAIIPQIFDRAESELGAVDILINNAAYCVPDTFISQLSASDRAPDGFPLLSFTPDLHDKHFAVNSRGTALMMYEFARRFAQRGAKAGRIINVSTDAAHAFAGQISYGASKHSLEAFSRAAAIEFGRYDITVNVASLGPIQTGWIAPELETPIANDTPLGRIGYPADVADAIILLASEQARWISGQLIYVGGGVRVGL